MLRAFYFQAGHYSISGDAAAILKSNTAFNRFRFGKIEVISTASPETKVKTVASLATINLLKGLSISPSSRV
jgi:hypothetical protein